MVEVIQVEVILETILAHMVEVIQVEQIMVHEVKQIQEQIQEDNYGKKKIKKRFKTCFYR